MKLQITFFSLASLLNYGNAPICSFLTLSLFPAIQIRIKKIIEGEKKNFDAPPTQLSNYSEHGKENEDL